MQQQTMPRTRSVEQSQGFVGSWRVTISPAQGTPTPALATLGADGTLLNDIVPRRGQRAPPSHRWLAEVSVLSQQRRNLLFAVVGTIVALCLATSALCVAGQPLLLRWPVPFGYVMSVCAVFRTAPLVVGFFWSSPFLSSVMPPYGGPGAGCLVVPWLPFLPQRGELLFPA